MPAPRETSATARKETDPLLVSARIIGDLRNVVKHKMHGRKLERVGTSLASYNILISLRIPSRAKPGTAAGRQGPSVKKARVYRDFVKNNLYITMR